jgi:glycerol-3-phosphate O-acyltransferase
MSSTGKPRVIVSWWLAVFQAILVRYVRISEEWIEQVRAAARNGPVVFIMRNRSLIDLLCVRGLCRRYDLPSLGFVSGISPFVFLPWWRWLLAVFRRRLPDRQRQRLADTLRASGSAVVFLRRPAFGDALGSRPVEIDGVRLAVEAQAEVGGQVIALPTVFLWGEHAMHRLRKPLDIMVGSQEYPRLLRSLWLLIRRRSVHGAWIGSPLELETIRRERGVDDAGLAGIVRAGVGRSIEKIRRSRLGGLTKPSSRVKAELLNSGRLMAELEVIARDEGIPREEILPRARDMINKLATDFRPRVLTLFSWVMAVVWRRIYTGIDVGENDFENLRTAVARGPLLILPDHRSHIDYMAISQVMEDANVMLPHIAAGENLSFWPLGWLFRSSGAFFIRRKFINDRFYTAVVNGYVRRLIQEGYAIEVFIEGGRSRTGKVLRPKLGMIEMSLRALALTPRRDVGILPTFIGYEKVIEESAYIRELEGKKKKKEGIGSLLAATKVLFHRYGRLYVRTGAFFSVQEVLDEMKVTREQLLQGSRRRAVAEEIALRTFVEINRITVVTPSALLSAALLTSPGGRVRRSEMRRLALDLARFLAAWGAGVSRSVDKWLEAGEAADRKDPVNRLIGLFERAGRLRFLDREEDPAIEVVPEQRMTIDYYKNNIVHFFAPASLVAMIVLARDGASATMDEIREELGLACRIYRWEFFLPDADSGEPARFSRELDALLAKGVGHLVAAGLAHREGGSVTATDVPRLRAIRDVLRNFHEVFLSALHTSRQRVFGEMTGDPSRLARAHYDQALAARRFIKPEGKSRIAIQDAFQACKDLKLNRPASDEHPFDEGQLGDRLISLLETAISD